MLSLLNKFVFYFAYFYNIFSLHCIFSRFWFCILVTLGFSICFLFMGLLTGLITPFFFGLSLYSFSFCVWMWVFLCISVLCCYFHLSWGFPVCSFACLNFPLFLSFFFSSMGCSKSSARREVYSNKSLPEKTR